MPTIPLHSIGTLECLSLTPTMLHRRRTAQTMTRRAVMTLRGLQNSRTNHGAFWHLRTLSVLTRVLTAPLILRTSFAPILTR
jgi:hypothetical protein